MCANAFSDSVLPEDFKMEGGKKQKGLLFHRIQVSFNLTFLLSSPCDMGDKDDLFSP